MARHAGGLPSPQRQSRSAQLVTPPPRPRTPTALPASPGQAALPNVLPPIQGLPALPTDPAQLGEALGNLNPAQLGDLLGQEGGIGTLVGGLAGAVTDSLKGTPLEPAVEPFNQVLAAAQGLLADPNVDAAALAAALQDAVAKLQAGDVEGAFGALFAALGKAAGQSQAAKPPTTGGPGAARVRQAHRHGAGAGTPKTPKFTAFHAKVKKVKVAKNRRSARVKCPARSRARARASCSTARSCACRPSRPRASP